MVVRYRRWLLVPLLLLVAGVAALVLVIRDNLPSFPSASPVAVQALPGDSSPRRYNAYDGPHPRLWALPPDPVSYPIGVGETGPVVPHYFHHLYQQNPERHLSYPFYCGRDNSRATPLSADPVLFPQPQIDNHVGAGVPVFAEQEGELLTDQPLGYSRDCQYPTQVRYFYRHAQDGQFYPLDEADNPAIAQIEVDNESIPFVVRLETGTINRFLYAMAMLTSPNIAPEAMPDNQYWNDRLIYYFRGGVGIGWKQGDFSPHHLLDERVQELARGYGVVYSTGNQSANHFDVLLAADTSQRVKRQFAALYGPPRHTIGIGGSGGAIQQYLMAQNNPGLLDGIIPIYSYPDMVTQTIAIQECELLEYYFDEMRRRDDFWQQWENRSLVEGMNADSDASNRYAATTLAARLMQGRWLSLPRLRGSSSCVTGWRGMTPLVSNPRFTPDELNYSPAVVDQVNWSYWDNLAYLFGTDADGFGLRTWDNVGVQYGLAALRDGSLDRERFLDLNRQVGGWAQPAAMQEEEFWLLNGPLWPARLSFHSRINQVPQRTIADSGAVAAAYHGGVVFMGFADVPILDVRHYLDLQLDMHYASASRAARARIAAAMGNSDHHIIWMTRRPHDPQALAVEVMDEWLTLQAGQTSVQGPADARPPRARDSCFDAAGELLHGGEGVWSEQGACTQAFPLFPTSRQVAGDDEQASVFKCHLIEVEEAIGRGWYGELEATDWQAALEDVFPDGVCDYSRGDAARPPGVWESLQDEMAARWPRRMPR